MKNTQSEISTYIDNHKDELIRVIQEAVQIPSTVGQEQKMQEFMQKKYEELGLKTIVFQPDYEKISKHPGFSDSGIPFEGRNNVIGILEGDENAKSLTLEGHVDVVSPVPLTSWDYDPWGGEIEGNRLYGRGSQDMKAGLMANWFALKTLLDLNLKPRGTVQLHSTIEEEAGGGGGALACMEEGYVTDGYLTTEPHGLRVTISHAGVMYFRVTVIGRTAHASRTQDGVNAIGKMYRIYSAFEELEKHRAENVHFDLYHKGTGGQSVNLNMGTLQAGDWVSNVAGKAVLECRIGFIPGESREDIRNLVEKTIADAIQGDEWLEENPPSLEWFGWTTEAWYQDPEHPYVQSFMQTAKGVLNKEIEIIGRTGGNDARFTAYYDRPGIGFGPHGGNIHGPNEYVEIDSVIETAKVLANHILEWSK